MRPPKAFPAAQATETPEPVTYNLLSSGMVWAPGIIRWAINGYAFQKDRKQLRHVVVSTWSVPEDAVRALLQGDVKWTEDAEGKVTFTYPVQL